MKKNLLLLCVLFMGVSILLPQTSQAMKTKKFKHYYLGTWENTYDTCSSIGQTGEIEIKLSKINKVGKITKAKVWFNDSRVGDMTARGKIFFNKKNVRRIRLHYTENNWADDYVINGRITKNKIVGTYDHTNSGCNWGGPVDLTKSN